jgi:hypothetical protein
MFVLLELGANLSKDEHISANILFKQHAFPLLIGQ